MKYGVDELLSGNHGDDLDIDFKAILGPTLDGEWQPEETDDMEETEGMEVNMSDNEHEKRILFIRVPLYRIVEIKITPLYM